MLNTAQEIRAGDMSRKKQLVNVCSKLEDIDGAFLK